MKKLMKRTGAILLAIAMMAALAVTAWASSATVPYDTPLTVTGLGEDDSVTFYKIIEWVGATTDKSDVSGWKAVAPYNTLLTTAKLKEVLVGTKGDPNATPPVADVAPTGITATLAGQLAKLAKDQTNGTTVDAVQDGTSYTATLNNTSEGMWMGIITSGNPDIEYNPVFVSADYETGSGKEGTVSVNGKYSDEATAKKSDTELKKTATVTEDSYADGNWISTAIGETVSFKVETTIPAFKDVYQHPFFKLTDKLSDLKLVANSVTVTKPANLTAGEDYTITEAADGKSYTVVFAESYLKTVGEATKVEVTYSAIVTTEAAVHVNPEKNEVWTEFTNNPQDESEHGYKKDDTIHYTFDIDALGTGLESTQTGKKHSEFIKQAIDANGEVLYKDLKTVSEIDERQYVESPLAGAEFKLYTSLNDDGTPKDEYIPKKADGTSAGEGLKITSDTDGRLTIKGLDAGTYYLKETKAPTGFTADTHVYKIEISMTSKSVDVTEWTKDGVTWISDKDYQALTDKDGYQSYTYQVDVIATSTIKIDGEVASEFHYTNDGTHSDIDWTVTPPVEVPCPIKNTQGTELPSTGGIGTYVFTVAGVAIMVIAAGLLIVRHRKKA